MILLDANILLYAWNKSSEHHAAASEWLEAVMNNPSGVALCWQTIHAFLRISTNRTVFTKALTARDAAAIVDEILSHPGVTVLAPGERHWLLLKELMDEARVTGPLVTDAALAAMAIEHGVALASTDRDFRRFRGLELIDPFAAEE